jgi:hypothetical protein
MLAGRLNVYIQIKLLSYKTSENVLFLWKLLRESIDV